MAVKPQDILDYWIEIGPKKWWARDDEVDSTIRERFGATHGVNAANGDAVQKTVDSVVEAWGQVDIMVNNAGITRDTLLPRMSDEDWDEVIASNLRSVFLFTRAAAQSMMRSKQGRIINISSIAGLIASDTMPAYNASKAAVWMLSKSIALHCAKKNMQIRSNSVHPTFVDTPILDGTA